MFQISAKTESIYLVGGMLLPAAPGASLHQKPQSPAKRHHIFHSFVIKPQPNRMEVCS